MSETLLVGVREAAQALGLGRDTTYELVRANRLRAVRVGRRILIARAELDAFVERETQTGAMRGCERCDQTQ